MGIKERKFKVCLGSSKERSTLEIPRVLLQHTMPALYRIELFNSVEMLLKQRNIKFFVIFQYLTSKRRSFWGDLSEKCHFNFIRSKNIGLGSAYHSIRIPLRPFKELAEYSPDIIIANGFNLHTVFAFIYSNLKKIPLIIWSGENEIRGLGKSLRILVRKLILRRTSHLLTYGTATQMFYHNKFNFRRSRMTNLLNVIPVTHDINVPAQIELKKRALEKGILRLIFVGDLKIRKGICCIPKLLDYLLSSFSDHNIEFVIIGSGPEEEALKNSLKLYQEKMVIHFLGKISNRQVLHEIAASHFLLFPTLGEPWGHVITEAFSVGTPVLTSRFPGAVSDILREGENGFVVDFDFPNQIANTISDTISNISKFEKICKFAKQSYHDIFNSLDNAKTMVDVIIKVLQDT